jgi:hypothetical protein
MATIRQLLEFMNENKIIWHPVDLVDVDFVTTKVPGYEGYESGVIKGKYDDVYVRHDCQRYIGHYYELPTSGDVKTGVMLLPLSTGKYLKANYSIAV